MPKEIEQLIHGYQVFQKQYFKQRNLLFDDLVRHGQRPKVLMIACSDSRVDPAIITNAQPGDLFVVRNVANLVPPYENDDTHHGTSAALEFAICGLGIRHIVVFGHSQCGGIQALMQSSATITGKDGFINKWMQLANPARQFVEQHYSQAPLEKQVEVCCQQSLMRSLENLKTFPWIDEKIKQHELFLHAWYFDLSSGVIQCFDEQQTMWRPL